MKTRIAVGGIYLMKAVLRMIYSVMKLFPVKDNKVLFCSRQESTPSLDFRMLRDALLEARPDLDIVMICNRNTGRINLSFGWDTLRSMMHLASAPVCILDTYWPAASILHHKEQLTIIQIWHAIGKIKRSGKISAGTATGRSKKISDLLQMHENNDYIIAGAPVFDPFYRDSFGEGNYQLRNYGLPRIDHLLQTEEENRQRFFQENPALAGKPILLYVPTFRRGMEAHWQDIIQAVDLDRYTLIIKNHPSQRIDGERPAGVYYFDDWKSVDLLAAADYVITDYSAIALEAAVLAKKTCYWVYDYDEYVRLNGLNVDMYQSMPGTVFRDAREMMAFIDSGTYPQEVLQRYRQTYLPVPLGQSTRQITDLILSCLEGGGKTA